MLALFLLYSSLCSPETTASHAPLDIVKFTSAYGTMLKNAHPSNKKIVIGRDGRISGSMVQGLVSNTLIALGFDVVDLGLSTTPTVEMAVVMEKAVGGIILTASHNPKEWNALKLLNEKGEFISGAEGKELLEIAFFVKGKGWFLKDPEGPIQFLGANKNRAVRVAPRVLDMNRGRKCQKK